MLVEEWILVTQKRRTDQIKLKVIESRSYLRIKMRKVEEMKHERKRTQKKLSNKSRKVTCVT